MLLAKMTWETVESYLGKDDRIIVPLGSTEQHGPLGRIGTDHSIPGEIAQAVSEQTETITAPPISIGMSEHHLDFPGTISVKAQTLVLLISDVLESLYQGGFRRILIINGHGGNKAPSESAVARVTDTYSDLQVIVSLWLEEPEIREIIQEKFGSEEGIHGTPSELSVVGYIYGELVQKTYYQRQPYRNIKQSLNREVLKIHYPDGSVNANQALADIGIGSMLFETAVALYSRMLDNWC